MSNPLDRLAALPQILAASYDPTCRVLSVTLANHGWHGECRWHVLTGTSDIERFIQREEERGT